MSTKRQENQKRKSSTRSESIISVGRTQRIANKSSAQQGMLTHFLEMEPLTQKSNEMYMCQRHLDYFQEMLTRWQNRVLQDAQHTLENLKRDNEMCADPLDTASQIESVEMTLQSRERDRALLKKIERSLQKIENKTYGFCEMTGEEIGLGRLMVRPIAEFTVQAQERHEREQMLHRSRDNG